LRSNKFTKAFILVSSAPKFEITEKRNGAIKFVNVPVALEEKGQIVDFFLSLFLEQFLGKYVNLPCGDPETADLVDLLCRLAGSNASVLINGPTGTGKEVVARLLHAKSFRKDEPFIAVNCAAIPENMLESMLFGHEKGAFTGAMQANSGLFRAAHTGTILLDEISEMPMALQSKLLRVLQEKVVTPVGSTKEVTIDVRVLATTNRNMVEEIHKNNFREDLFYRLNVFPISTCSLKLRPLDIPVISAHLLTRNSLNAKTLKILSPKALDRLMQHDWPGNVRELRNTIERAMVYTHRRTIDDNVIYKSLNLTAKVETVEDKPAFDFDKLQEAEQKNIIIDVLARFKGNKKKAATELGVHFSTLHRRIKRLKMEDIIPQGKNGRPSLASAYQV
jgi:two-component system response regulator FlrC